MNKYISLNSIIDRDGLGMNHVPVGTDKGYPKMYTSNVYEEIFDLLRRRNIRILELGIRTGASLKLWAEYFPNAIITGVDLSDENVEKFWVANPRIRTIYGDAYTVDFLMGLGNFDVIIDDGPHSLSSQIFTIQNYLKLLNPGGFLFIEDIIGGKPFIDKLLSNILGKKNLQCKVFDLRRKSDSHDSIVIGIYKKIKDENYWDEKNQKIYLLKLRLALYNLLSACGVGRFKLS